jgi:uncharacterized protein YkwD
MRAPLTVLLTLTATSLIAATPAQAACPGENDPVTSANIAASEATMVCMVNEFRAGSGRQALVVDSRLTNAARAHSESMVRNNFFDHSADGSLLSRYVAAGYPARAEMGENIGKAEGAATPRNLFDEFLTSSAHVANMLDPAWRAIGVGFVVGPVPGQNPRPDGVTLTQAFGSVLGDGSSVSGSGSGGSSGACDQIPSLEAKVAHLKDRVATSHGSKLKKAKKKLGRAKRALRNARAFC